MVFLEIFSDIIMPWMLCPLSKNWFSLVKTCFISPYCCCNLLLLFFFLLFLNCFIIWCKLQFIETKVFLRKGKKKKEGKWNKKDVARNLHPNSAWPPLRLCMKYRIFHAQIDRTFIFFNMVKTCSDYIRNFKGKKEKKVLMKHFWGFLN